MGADFGRIRRAVGAWLPRLPALALLLAPLAAGAQGLPALTSSPLPGGATSYSLSVQTLLLLTSLTFILKTSVTLAR